jgi:hypothetical protein
MSESADHVRLVDRIVIWLNEHYCNKPTLCIFRDGDFVGLTSRPPIVNQFVPDVFAEDTPPTITAIGEAKIATDIESKRSQIQLRAFIEFLSIRPKPQLIVAAPPVALNTARRIVQLAKAELNAQHVDAIFL